MTIHFVRLRVVALDENVCRRADNTAEIHSDFAQLAAYSNRRVRKTIQTIILRTYIHIAACAMSAFELDAPVLD
jgi:hypothetical protein